MILNNLQSSGIPLITVVSSSLYHPSLPIAPPSRRGPFPPVAIASVRKAAKADDIFIIYR
jgi:hypothetical protein